MSNAQSHIIDALVALEVCPNKKITIERQLGDGPTNETWLLSCDSEQYVLRLVKPFASKIGLSLEKELNITLAAQEQGLSPKVVASCVTRGVVLCQFIEGRTWAVDDIHNKKQLARLADTLKQLHKLECDAQPLDVRAALHDYAKRSSDSQAIRWRDNALAQFNQIGSRDFVVCHNDLIAANIIDNGKLYLIDWEYAALGDPLFDLAVVAVHHQLDQVHAFHWLSMYLGYSDATIAADFQRWCEVYRYLLALWQSLDETKAKNFNQDQT